MTAITYALLALYAFWNLYVYSMGLYRAKLHGRLNGFPLLMCAPVVAITFIIDAMLQFTIASLVFWQWPKGLGIEWRESEKYNIRYPLPSGDWLVTHRLRRYIIEGNGWRYRLAAYICKYLTDPFDPTGAHCDSDEPKLSEIVR